MTKRSVLIVTPSADGYGSDRALIGVVAKLGERYDLTVVSAVEGPTLDALRALGAEVIVAPDFAMRRRFLTPKGIGPAALRVLRTAALLRKLHRTRNFAGVYVNTVANMIMPLIRTAVPVPIIVHAREVPKASRVQGALIIGSVRRVASVVLTNSTFTAQAFREMAPELSDRIAVVHDGVDDPGLVARPAEAFSAPLEIVCVGRLHPQKGQLVLAEAVRWGIESGADYRLHLWGDALEEHRYVEDALGDYISFHGLGERVILHGYTPDTPSMYSGMDVAVVPSQWPEGFSLVTAEAQAAGLATIATVPGGPADIIVEGETGLLVPIEDIGVFRDALAELEDPQVRAVMGAAARERYLERFTTQRSATAVAERAQALFG